MDSFPIRRGIGLSRTPQANTQFQSFNRQPQVKLPQHMNRTLPPQIAVMNRVPNYYIELNQPQNPQNHHRTYSNIHPHPHQQKIAITEPNMRDPMTKQIPVQSYLNENNSFKFTPFPSPPINPQYLPQQTFRTERKTQPVVSQVNTAPAQSKPSIEFHPMEKAPTTQRDSMSPIKPVVSIILNEQKQQIKQKSQTQSKITVPSQEMAFQQPNLIDIVKTLQKQKEQLLLQLRNTASNQAISQLSSQKAKLQQILDAKALQFKEQQQKSALIEKQLKEKVTGLEYELRLLKGNKNRLQIEIDSNKKIARSQRQKNQRARQQMSKLIFFEDDLIHAKDYNKLKDQVEYIATENAKLFQEHQQYIHEVGESRKVLEGKINELEEELSKLKSEYSSYRTKIDQYIQNGEDKMVIIKLQNELNFLRKKNEEQSIQLCKKGQQLQKFMLEMKDLTLKNKENNRNFLDQINIRQIQETVLLYEARISDLSENLSKKQLQCQKQKKTIELLASQLRHTREDKRITSLKGKSNEDSLKNEVQILQKGHQAQLELRNKKISNLQQALLRKSKEISEKDRLIKECLISRVKQSNNTSLQQTRSDLKECLEPATSIPTPAPSDE